jgi:hypothetical protein
MKNEVILPVNQRTVTNFYIPKVPQMPVSALKIRKTVHYYIMGTKGLVKLSEKLSKATQGCTENGCNIL